MGVHPAYPRAGEASPIDHRDDLVVSRDRARGQVSQKLQDLLSLFQVAKRELANDEGMNQYLRLFQEGRESGIALPEVGDPDRGVDEDHGRVLFGGSVERRRRTERSAFSVPPRAARRLALSWATSA